MRPSKHITGDETDPPLLALYAIQRSGSEWGICLNGNDMDIQLSLEAAVTAAKDAYAKGFGATVTIQSGHITAPL